MMDIFIMFLNRLVIIKDVGKYMRLIIGLFFHALVASVMYKNIFT